MAFRRNAPATAGTVARGDENAAEKQRKILPTFRRPRPQPRPSAEALRLSRAWLAPRRRT